MAPVHWRVKGEVNHRFQRRSVPRVQPLRLAARYGIMRCFSASVDEQGQMAYRAFNSEGRPLTVDLNAFNFCVWVVCTQFPLHSSHGVIEIFVPMFEANLAVPLLLAQRLVNRNAG